jgi:Cu/Ag efflux protein CusF
MKIIAYQLHSQNMKTTNVYLLFLRAILCASLAFVLTQDTRSSAAEPLSAEHSLLVTVTAKVQAIDIEKREVTLKGPLGNVVTFEVDERVKRLNEVKVGDEVTADYFVSLAGELREPTDEEKKTPLTVLEGGARAPKGASPAGGKLRAFKVVATVVGLDLPTQSVTLQGPLGNTVAVRAASVDNLKKLRLGDSIVVTYTEALAISLQKAQHQPAKE